MQTEKTKKGGSAPSFLLSKRETPSKKRGFLFLDARNVSRLRSFVGRSNLETHFVPYAKIIKVHVDKIVGVEKKIVLSFSFNETESSLCKGFDCAFHLKFK